MRAWVAADAWLLFDAVMKGAGRWYEWQEGKAHADPGPLPSHVQLNVSGDTRVKQYIAPIVEDCDRIQSVLLKGVDPELWKAMQTAGMEPQIYGMSVFMASIAIHARIRYGGRDDLVGWPVCCGSY